MTKKRKPIPRPGGRSARVRAAVEDAVRWLIQKKPLTDISIADIAERSGVHATSIYRRWGSVQALLLDIAVDRISQESPMPDTGSLEGDLFAWGRRVAGAMTGPNGPLLLRTVIQAEPSDRAMLLRRADEIQFMLDRAAARGEPRLGYQEALDVLFAPIMLRGLFGIGGLDDGFLRTLVRRAISLGKPSTAKRTS